MNQSLARTGHIHKEESQDADRFGMKPRKKTMRCALGVSSPRPLDGVLLHSKGSEELR